MNKITSIDVDNIINTIKTKRYKVVSLNEEGSMYSWSYSSKQKEANLAEKFGLDPKRWHIKDCRIVPPFGYLANSNQIVEKVNKEISSAQRILLVSRTGNYYDQTANGGKINRSQIPIAQLKFYDNAEPEQNGYSSSHYYNSSNHYDKYRPYAVVTIDDQEVLITGSFSFFNEVFGAIVNRKLQIECGSFEGPLARTNLLNIVQSLNGRIEDHSVFPYKIRDFDFDDCGLSFLCNCFSIQDDESKSNIVQGLLDAGLQPSVLKPTGATKLYKKIQEFELDFLQNHPLDAIFFRTLLSRSGNSVHGVKISSVINEVFKDVDSVESLRKAMKPFVRELKKNRNYNWLENAISSFDAYKDKRRNVLSKQTDRAFSKLMQEYESLDLDEKKYPKLVAAIKAGDIPVSTFFRKSEQYFLLNDNWILWEKMLKVDYDTTVKLAKEVSRRTTYEKDLMSYFYFVLYDLPEYLKKQTGDKWTCSPRLIESESELNPPEADDNGIVRSRSALTPIVDNKAKTVVVPYASLSISGRQVTYCYSHSYHVLRKGLMFNGNVCMSDVEEKLNGRDDYGLMFYTLTGSAQGRGYPTFLIIFERHVSNDVTVHFHRTHPSRSKDGDYNPIHNWIKVCYNWMAGNIRAENIKAQQGDLVFVKIDDSENLNFERKVTSYDHHRFEKPVPFAEYTKKAKSNILGYVKIEQQMYLTHNQHDDEQIPAGTYAIHQCRSWEANPKSIWVLNID